VAGAERGAGVALFVLGLHVLGVVAWIGGVLYQAHMVRPAARAGHLALFAETASRARAVAWTAAVVVVLTGFYNVTQLGPVELVMASGAGLRLAGKFILVLLLIAVAGHRDFAVLPRLRAAVAAGEDPRTPLAALAWLDRLVLLLALAIVYLGLSLSRA
jgi:putative copper export protein